VFINFIRLSEVDTIVGAPGLSSVYSTLEPGADGIRSIVSGLLSVTVVRAPPLISLDTLTGFGFFEGKFILSLGFADFNPKSDQVRKAPNPSHVMVVFPLVLNN